MRTLVLAQDFPWPTGSGSFLRLANVIDALANHGDVDLFATVLTVRDQPCDLPGDAPVGRYETATYPRPDYSFARRARWLLGHQPLEIVAQQLEGPAARLREWARPPYDFVWCSKATTFAGLGRPDMGPTVVDLDDLEDRKIRARLESGSHAASYPQTLSGQAHRQMAAFQGRMNARRWQRLQESIASEVDAVVVCSELDAERLGVANAWIVPNGYNVPPLPVGRSEVRTPPSLLFQGVLHYGPNADAVRWLVDSIGPALRRHIPDVEIVSWVHRTRRFGGWMRLRRCTSWDGCRT